MSHLFFTNPTPVTTHIYGSVRAFDFTSDKMDIDASSLVKAGARKLHDGAVGLYGFFDKDNAVPAGKRGKFEQDIEMKVAVLKADDVPAKPGFAGLKKRVRSLRALAKAKLLPSKKTSKADQLMDIDEDFNATPSTFMFTFSARSVSPERAREGQGVVPESVISTPSSVIQSATDNVPATTSKQRVDVPASATIAINELAVALSRLEITPVADGDRCSVFTAPGLVVSTMNDRHQGKVREHTFSAGPVIGGGSSIKDMWERYMLEVSLKAQDGLPEPGTHSQEGDAALTAPEDSDETHTVSVVALGHAPKDAVHAAVDATDDDTPPQGPGVGPPSSSLSVSISSLTVVSADDDIHGSLSDDADANEDSAPESIACAPSGILWSAREPSPVISDEDKEMPIKLILTQQRDADVCPALPDASIDDLVTLFSQLSCREVETETLLTTSKDETVVAPIPADTLVTVFVEVPNHPQDSPMTSSPEEDAIACPAPADNAVDSSTIISDDQSSSNDLTEKAAASSPPAPLAPLTFTQADCGPVSIVNAQEDDCETWFDASDVIDDDEDVDEIWYEASDVVEDEDEDENDVWHDCQDTFKAVVDNSTFVPAQSRFPQHDTTVLPGGFYDHDDELDVDFAGDLRILRARLTAAITRTNMLITSWLGSSF